jgi:hypothetical protein
VATILPCLHGAHTKSFWYSNFGNPQTKPSPSSMTTSQNSSDLVSYAISKAPPEHQQPSNEKSQHTEKIASENQTLGDDRAHKIISRVQNMRTTRFETNFKTLIKKLGNREMIVFLLYFGHGLSLFFSSCFRHLFSFFSLMP